MLSTNSILTQLKLQAPEWTAQGDRGLLPIVDMVNRKMVNYDCRNNMIMDTATGLYPLLVTTAGTFQYTMPVNYRKVDMVLVQTRDLSIDYYRDINRIPFHFNNYQFYSIAGNPVQKGRTGNAQWMFTNDPGTTTDRYYVVAYKEATNITGLGVYLDVPQEYDDVVINGCLAWIESIQNGNRQSWRDWLTNDLPEYWDNSNKSGSYLDYTPPSLG